MVFHCKPPICLIIHLFIPVCFILERRKRNRHMKTTGPNRAKPNMDGPSRAGTSRAGPNRAGPSRAEPNRTRPRGTGKG